MSKVLRNAIGELLRRSASGLSLFVPLLMACTGSGPKTANEPAPPVAPSAAPTPNPTAEPPVASARPATSDSEADVRARHTYFTGGVHNDKGCERNDKCVYPRKPGEPTDPSYPAFWTSEWTMYRVFKNYDKFPPPYASPPAGLTKQDYEVSHGASYYDSSYAPVDGDGQGAMMEHYEKRCLPIFPSSNQYTCSFVSLGNKAYFLRYDDRPAGTPQCCQFSLDNHPPRPDFIKHLPYNAEQSKHLGASLQAYSISIPPGILFGYAFYKKPTTDGVDKKAPPYRHPQSFFFSGEPSDPPNAPIVSQNFSNFRMEKPDPQKTWAQVSKMCPAKPEWCCLFASDCPDKQSGALKSTPDWATLKH